MQFYVVTTSFFIALLRQAESMALEAACATDDECLADTPNSYCMPADSPSCLKGSCECQPHLVESSSACLQKRYYGDSCTTGQSCMQGTTCISGRCQCSVTHMHSDVLHMCVNGLSTPNLIGGPCNDASECYTDPSLPGSVECVVIIRTGQAKQCSCVDGYIHITQTSTCRKPHFGEACSLNVGCESQKPDVVTFETAFSTEVCTDGKCACPDDHTEKKMRIEGVNIDLCVATTTGVKVGYGQTCTSTSDCAAGICYDCPEYTDKKCALDTV